MQMTGWKIAGAVVSAFLLIGMIGSACDSPETEQQNGSVELTTSQDVITTTTTAVPTTSTLPPLPTLTTTAKAYIPPPIVQEEEGDDTYVYYKYCSDAPHKLRMGESGYRSELDRDGDGVACETAG